MLFQTWMNSILQWSKKGQVNNWKQDVCAALFHRLKVNESEAVRLQKWLKKNTIKVSIQFVINSMSPEARQYEGEKIVIIHWKSSRLLKL